tara:strand:+ start:51 stop:965 length:915 start_codon:yes stop_codon:yes gene_type:complete
VKNLIVRLGNGIGNQLFTYAAAYSYSKKINMNLLIDNESGFHKRFKYELNDFKLTAKIADKEYKFIGHLNRLKRKVFKKYNFLKKDLIFITENLDKNKFTEYDKNFFNYNPNNNIYLEGYFQSEKYFIDFKKDLLNEFTFKDEIKNKFNKYKEQIIKNNSVSIHVRKNKFLKDENHTNLDLLNNENLNINIDLINRGVKYFENKIENPKFFVWSNDFEGLREYFPSNKFIFIDNGKEFNDNYDLYLMTLCKNFIISPSTFHYWGSYLANNENKICLSPPYFKNKSGYYGFSNNKDIKPDWWVSY